MYIRAYLALADNLEVIVESEQEFKEVLQMIQAVAGKVGLGSTKEKANL